MYFETFKTTVPHKEASDPLLRGCESYQVLKIRCKASLFQMQSTLKHIQNYSTKFEMHARNPALICYCNDYDAYRAQYFSPSFFFFFFYHVPLSVLVIDTDFLCCP
jgi:hypothetical protein